MVVGFMIKIKAVKTYSYLVTYSMLLSYLQGYWRNGHQSHAVGCKKLHFFELKNTGCAGIGFGLLSSNFPTLEQLVKEQAKLLY